MSEETGILFVRGIPKRLLQKVKSCAALDGMTMKEWFERLLKEATSVGRTK